MSLSSWAFGTILILVLARARARLHVGSGTKQLGLCRIAPDVKVCALAPEIVSPSIDGITGDWSYYNTDGLGAYRERI